MIVSHSRRFIVFSMPKTGSESLRAMLAPFSEEHVQPWRATSAARPFYPHMPPSEARTVFLRRGWDFDGYRRVTVIRNPYPRLVSLYRMIADVDGLWRLRCRAGIGPPPFADWLRRTRPFGRGGGGRPHQRWRRFGTYSAQTWTRSADGDALVTHILPLETLDLDLPALLADLGLPEDLRLPVRNRRTATDCAEWYDPETTALVARRYRWDLRSFYRMPDKSEPGASLALTVG